MGPQNPKEVTGQVAHDLTQLRLFALEEAGWIKALKLSGYAPSRHRKQAALQDDLFSFLAETGG